MMLFIVCGKERNKRILSNIIGSESVILKDIENYVVYVDGLA